MANNNATFYKIDDDSNIQYENNSFFVRFFSRLIILPILNTLPWKGGTFIFTKSSKSAASIYKLSKTSSALEFLYTFNGKFDFTNSFLDSFFTFFWQHNILNAKAARNRIKLVKRELSLAIEDLHRDKKRPINVFSLASGSARAIIEVAADLKKAGVLLEVKLLDLSPEALALSKKIALEKGVEDGIVEYCNDKVSNFLKYCKDWKPDIIEMVGFLDYLNQDKAIKLSSDIFSVLPLGGIFITCNIRNNYERKFISKVVDWQMIYREPEELLGVLLGGGFKPQKCKIIYDPTLIHGLALGIR